MAQSHLPGSELLGKDVGCAFSPEPPFSCPSSMVGGLLDTGPEFQDSVVYPNRFRLRITVVIGVTVK